MITDRSMPGMNGPVPHRERRKSPSGFAEALHGGDSIRPSTSRGQVSHHGRTASIGAGFDEASPPRRAGTTATDQSAEHRLPRDRHRANEVSPPLAVCTSSRRRSDQPAGHVNRAGRGSAQGPCQTQATSVRSPANATPLKPHPDDWCGRRDDSDLGEKTP